MKTLIVYFSQTGTTRRLAELAAAQIGGVIDEVVFDQASNTITCAQNPADFERVLILSPVWAFSLATPMKLYVAKHGGSIKNYSLAVTYKLAGLRGCVSGCKKAIGTAPRIAAKFKAKDLTADRLNSVFAAWKK